MLADNHSIATSSSLDASSTKRKTKTTLPFHNTKWLEVKQQIKQYSTLKLNI